MVRNFCQRWFGVEEGKLSGLSREQLLLDLAYIPGVYVPQFYDMASDGSVHPNRPNVLKRIPRRVATHASLLDWVGT